MPAALTFRSVADFGLAPAAALLTRGFSDYLVPLAFSAGSVSAMARADQVDYDASVVVLRDDTPAGIALIARRGDSCRLAGMCLNPDARGAGIGRQLLEHTLTAARARGDRAMVLEVINQNAPALALYRRTGFTTVRQLLGFSAPAFESRNDAPGVAQRDLVTCAALAANREPADLPWQISAATLATVDPHRYTARAVGDFWVLAAELAPQRALIRGLIPTADPLADAQALRAICATWPRTTWQASALFPAEWSDRFTGAGFTPTELSQSQMRLEL